MQVFKRLLKDIGTLIPTPKISNPQVQRIGNLNPDKFSVKDVAIFLKVSSRHAKRLCESGVRNNVFCHVTDSPSFYCLRLRESKSSTVYIS